MKALPQPLMSYSPAGGCACKMPQSLLEEVTAFLGENGALDEKLLVGLNPPDDAAVYAIDDHRALVITPDFLTPVVTDMYDWGRIAAANGQSHLHATRARRLMGRTRL